MTVGQVVGAIVGYFVPGVGVALGAAIGGALDPPKGPTIKGPRLRDLTSQTADFGAPMGYIDGTVAISGNCFWIENNSIREVVKSENSGGKGGGGGTTTKTYSYFGTWAVALTDHEVDAMGRLWLGSDLVANPLSTHYLTALLTFDIFGGFAQFPVNDSPHTVRLYRGTDDQDPDPRMEADLGVGSCPAYRGMSYLVFYDWPLEKGGNSIAGLPAVVELITDSAAGSPVLLHSETFPAVTDASDILPLCNYLTPYKAVVWCPHWGAEYPAESTIERISYIGETSRHDFSQSVTNPYIPQRGIGDSSSFVATDVFEGSAEVGAGSFDGASGVFVYKGGVFYGSSWANDALWRWHTTDMTFDAITTATGYGDAHAITADDDGVLYAVHGVSSTTATIYTYDDTLGLIASQEITFAPSSGVAWSNGSTFMYWDRGVLFLVFGGNARYIHYLPDDLSSDPIYLGDIGDFPTNVSGNANVSVINGILTRFGPHTDRSSTVERWKLPYATNDTKLLSAVVSERVQRSELIGASDIDVTLLTDVVRGYKTAGTQPLRSQLEPLMRAYQFDAVQDGYQIKFIPHGQSSVVTLDADDLIGDVMLHRERQMDTQLPQKTVVRHLDAAREYGINEQYSTERRSSSTVNVEEVEFPIVFTADEAAGVAEVLEYAAWVERDTFRFKLPHNQLQLQPGDVVTLPTDSATHELRILSITYTPEGVLECEAVPNDASLYITNAVGGDGVAPDGTLAYPGESAMVLLDIPLIRDADDSYGFAAAMSGYSSDWNGGVVMQSVDAGQIYASVQGFAGEVVMGIATNLLADHDCYVIDYSNTLTVNLNSPDMALTSVTEAQMMTGLNWCALGVDGRWEILRFANATLNADGTYTLDTLVRGCRGTEWAASQHTALDTFVFLSDADMARIGSEAQYVGVEHLYRGVTSEQDIDEVSDTAFTYRGVNLKPLSPVNLTGGIDGSNNWDLAWIERSRFTTGWWTTGVERTNEPVESYEIDIMNGAAVVRTLTSITNAVEYTSAQQVTDFGGNQTTLTFRVYQISATVGRGYVAEATLP